MEAEPARERRKGTNRDPLTTIFAISTADLKTYQRLAKRGDAGAVHAMRVATAHLRTALRFFAPWIDERPRQALARELRWLSKALGGARDVDIALGRGRPRGPERDAWQTLRRARYRQLGRSLSSKRYQRLIAHLAYRAKPNQSRQDGLPSEDVVWKRLRRWAEKLATRGKRLDRLGDRKLHSLRLRAKRVRYVAEWYGTLPSSRHAKRCKTIRNCARSLQRTLGHLADSHMHREFAEQAGLPELPKLAKLGHGKARAETLHTTTRTLVRLRQEL